MKEVNTNAKEAQQDAPKTPAPVQLDLEQLHFVTGGGGSDNGCPRGCHTGTSV